MLSVIRFPAPIRHVIDHGCAVRLLKHLAFATLLTTSATAQGADTITLRTDSGEDIAGELVSFENGMFRINSSIGLLAIPSADVICIGQGCPEGTQAEDPETRIVVTSLDGEMTISGDLLEVSNGSYVIATEVGEMRISLSDVTCEGPGCAIAGVDAVQDIKSAQVVLVGQDVTIEGKLVEDLPDAFVVDVDALGVIRVSKDAFACQGAGCP